MSWCEFTHGSLWDRHSLCALVEICDYSVGLFLQAFVDMMEIFWYLKKKMNTLGLIYHEGCILDLNKFKKIFAKLKLHTQGSK